MAARGSGIAPILTRASTGPRRAGIGVSSLRPAVMSGRNPRYVAVVAVTAAVILGVLGSLVAEVGHRYSGFFFSPDYRIFPVDPAAREAGLAVGDRIVAIDGASPLTLLARVHSMLKEQRRA